MPERIIGDKAYDSDKLDEAMAEQGIDMIAPHTSNRKIENMTQDGRPLRRYTRRWTVERTIDGSKTTVACASAGRNPRDSFKDIFI